MAIYGKFLIIRDVRSSNTTYRWHRYHFHHDDAGHELLRPQQHHHANKDFDGFRVKMW